MTTVAKGAGAAVDWLGELEHTPLAEVIRRIVFEERSGDLRVTSSNTVKTLHFDRGFIVFASSNLKSDSLGDRLISSGRISPHEFALVKMLTKGSKHSFRQTLSHAGIVPEEELGRHVAAQVNQIVLSLFSWKEGTYNFEEGPCSIPLELMVSLSAHRIMLEGIRRMSSGKLILAGLPPLDTMIRVVQAPLFSLDFEKLRPVEKSVLRIADTRISIRQILARAGEDKGKVLRACYALYASGVLESVSEDARKTPRRVQEETGTFVVSEILRKIVPREDAAEEPQEIPLQKVREVEAERPPDSEESPFSPQVAEEPAEPALKSFQEFEAEQAASVGDALPSAGEPKEGIWAQSFSALVATAKALWAAVATACRGAKLLWDELRGNAQKGWTTPSDAEPESQFESSATDTATLEPRAPLSQQHQVQSDQVVQEDASGEPSVPSWSQVDDPLDAPPPTADPVEFLAQSDEGPEITSLGVPKWSLRDEPDAAPAPPTDTHQETPPEEGPVIERFQPPSWSLEDVQRHLVEDPPPPAGKAHASPPTAPPEALVLGLEDEEPAEAEPGKDAGPEIVLGFEDEDPSLAPQPGFSTSVEADGPFADPLFANPDDRPPSTQELFIELEPEEDSGASMLKAIPVEDIHVEDEPDLVIVIEEDAFEDLPDVPDEPAPAPAPSPAVHVPESAKPKPKPKVKAKAKAKAKAKKQAKVDKPAPFEAEKPTAPPPQKKRAGPPPIVPNVELPSEAPPVRPTTSPSVHESPSPIFNEAPVPSFNEDPPMGEAEAPRAATPPASPVSRVSPVSAPSPVRQAPPAQRPPKKPAASPSARKAPTPGRREDTPKTQPAVGATEEQKGAQESEENVAANEGMVRARRMQQGGGEQRMLRDVKLHFKVQDWAGAVRLLEDLIQIAPGSALYRGMLARAMSRHPELRSDAEEHFHEALRLAPQDPEIHYWLGVYYLSFGLKARAINEFKTTLRIDPRHERARKQMSGGRSGGGGGVFKKLFG